MVTADPGTLAIEGVDGRNLYYVTAVAQRARCGGSRSPGGPWPNCSTASSTAASMSPQTASTTSTASLAIPVRSVPTPAGSGTRFRFFDFATGQSTTVAHNLGNVSFGLTASRDGGTVYFARIDSFADELMIGDDFR
jgi:hypothetical protein